MGKWQAVYWSDHDRLVRACDTQAEAVAFLRGGLELRLLRPEALIDPNGRTVALPGDPQDWVTPDFIRTLDEFLRENDALMRRLART